MSTDLAFEIRDSGIAGKGAFAIRPIAKGERVIEYVGERITHQEADRRYDDDSMDEHHTFLFTVSSRTVIDATSQGNESRYINHSCEPNCESEIARGRIFIFALRDIAVGEELHYDYAYQRSGDETAKDEAQYRCRCGTRTCRGSIMEAMEEFHRRRKEAQRKKAAARRSAAPGGVTQRAERRTVSG
ncbi:MAG: SET domain-containing protein-lysine N-methyltransferase [Gemmatimonadota bacterium]|nr:SET domain-containing protein-lysine N-methyltransferase [Gemmatimonadota bacterium]